MNRLVEANTAFALQLYGKPRSTAGNLALSPCSISSALAMTYAGARGDTARQMEQTLHFHPSKTGLHKAYIEVNEKGIEAAAATALDMVALGERRGAERPREFRADHPFLFLIRDSTTGSLLFVGRVVKPGA
jgi:serine protease inhibitor